MGKKSVSKICFCLAMMCIDGAGFRGVEREKCGNAGAGNERERGAEREQCSDERAEQCGSERSELLPFSERV
jgi:hypothetical protein